jgi:hypothetical protein
MWDALVGLLELVGFFVAFLLIARWLQSKRKPRGPVKSLEERNDEIIKKCWSGIRDDKLKS